MPILSEAKLTILRRKLAEAQTRPFALGSWDCGRSIDEWAKTLYGVEPMGFFADKYDSLLSLRAQFKKYLGGVAAEGYSPLFVAAFEKGFRAADFGRILPGEVEAGDFALVSMSEEGFIPATGIVDEQKYIHVVANGGVLLYEIPDIFYAWRFGR